MFKLKAQNTIESQKMQANTPQTQHGRKFLHANSILNFAKKQANLETNFKFT